MSERIPEPSALTPVYTYLQQRPASTRTALVAGTALLATLAVTVAALVDLGDAAALVGSPAGLVLFGCALAWRATIATPGQVAATDLKARLPLPRRRYWVGVAAALAAITVLTVGPLVPNVVAGTVVVLITAALVLAFRPSPAEADRIAAEAAAAAAAADDGHRS